uniref:Retrotransposon gag domain-containing protein n=1 Tax=Vitis vinifera TaxID=29760 RepID=A5C6X7_VITVI|nr:hypothetical protein VITISV_036802 [Vitis vinifera]
MAFGRQLHQAERKFRTMEIKVRNPQSTVRKFRTPQTKVVGVHKWFLKPRFCLKSLRITLTGQYMLFDRQSNMRLRRVIWNPWQSNGKLRNMKSRSFEVLCHKKIQNARKYTRTGRPDTPSEGVRTTYLDRSCTQMCPAICTRMCTAICTRMCAAICTRMCVAILHPAAAYFPPPGCSRPEFRSQMREEAFQLLRTEVVGVHKWLLNLKFCFKSLRITLNGQYMDKAKIWLNSLRPKSIKNWVDLQAEFLKKFFPTHRTNGLKRQISNFSAKENEKFYEHWERYMEAINACPHHGFDTWLLVSYFYDGMSSSMKQILETMCGGDFMSKNPEEAMDFLSYVSEVSRGWDEPNSREIRRMKAPVNPKGGMYMLSEDMDMKVIRAQLVSQLICVQLVLLD